MNAPVSPSTLVRHQFTHEDVLHLIVQKLVTQRVQLLDGDIYEMAEDGFQHKRWAMALAQLFMAKLYGQPYFVGVQTTLRLSKHNAPSPDLHVIAGMVQDRDATAEEILLVAEVADTSLGDDLTSTAQRYARHRVREYWVLDVSAPALHVHRDPADGVYPPPLVLGPDDAVTPSLLPQISVRLADLAPQL